MKLLPLEGGGDQRPSLAGCTLVVPAVGVGNVGQLAADLIIETSQAPRMGRLTDAALLPCVGVGAFSHVPGAAFGVELFSLPGTNVYVLQQRAPAAPGRQREFADSLAAWAKEQGVAQVRRSCCL